MDYTKEGTTSVKVHHAPGGRSNFSLAWDTEPVKPSKQVRPTPTVQPLAPQSQPTSTTTTTQEKTSVRVRVPPGGKSNIIFG